MCMLSKVYKVAAVLLITTAHHVWAIGPIFDCDKATTPLTRLICATPNLSQMDLEFVQAYFALRQQVGPGGWQDLKQEAVDFQSRVTLRCGISASGNLPPDTGTLAACLYRGYGEQRSVWLSRLTGAALEEASRPIEQHVASQRDLQTLGLLSPTATIDGVYGAATRSAILAWQHSHHLPEDGLLDNHTANMLSDDVQQHRSTLGANPPIASGANGPSTAANRVAADSRAKALAYDANEGNAASLDVLRAESARSDPSGTYGLSEYLFLQRSKKYGATYYTGLVDEYYDLLEPWNKSELDAFTAISREHPIGNCSPG